VKLAEHSFRALCEADTLEVMRARGLDPRSSGRTARVHCPFHGQGRERTPSLHVWPDGGWHCFSCRAGGRGAVDFLQQHDNLPSWLDAAEAVADILGLTLDYEGREAAAGPTHADLRAALARAAAHYAANLAGNPEALAYAERRGLSASIRSRWGIGYAVADRVRDCGAPEDLLVLAGILRRRDDGSTYDPLHARLVIPLHDPAGRIVGFAGRTLADSGPKYINTGDTPLFSKGRLVYALHRCRELLRRTPGPITIVEGQLKALACIEAGIPAAAPGGTAFTPEQAALVLGLSRTVRLSFDADAAGIKATRDAAALLRDAEAIVEVAALEIPAGAPEGTRDPDDLLAAGLPIAYRCRSVAAWAVEALPAQPPGSAAWAAELTGPVLDLIDTHPDPAVRHCELAEIAELTGLPVSALQRRRPPVPAPPAPPSAAVAPAAPDTAMTPGRLLCALALQTPLDLAAPNAWAAAVPWCDLPPRLASALLTVGLVRARAASRRLSVAGVLAEAGPTVAGQAGIADRLRHWATCPLPQPADAALWGELCRQIAADEHLRRIQEGLV